MKSNCLTYALDKWRTEGGYLVLRKSTHWDVPHVMHLSRDGRLSHYVPPDALARPWHALLGFDGIVRHDDTDEAGQIGVRGILVGAAIMLVQGVAWAMTKFCRGTG